MYISSNLAGAQFATRLYTYLVAGKSRFVDYIAPIVNRIYPYSYSQAGSAGCFLPSDINSVLRSFQSLGLVDIHVCVQISSSNSLARASTF